MKPCSVDPTTVGVDSERAGSVGEQRQDRRRRAEVVGVERPNVRPPDSGSGELRIVGIVLPSVSCGDKNPIAIRAGNDDVAWLVAAEKSGLDERGTDVAQIDDRDTVGKVVDDVHLLGVPRRDGDRFETDDDVTDELETAISGLVDFQAIVGSVHREKERAIRRECQRPHMPGLERHERIGLR